MENQPNDDATEQHKPEPRALFAKHFSWIDDKVPRLFVGGTVRMPIAVAADPVQCQAVLDDIVAKSKQPITPGWVEHERGGKLERGWVPEPGGQLELVEARDPDSAEVIVMWRFPHVPDFVAREQLARAESLH